MHRRKHLLRPHLQTVELEQATPAVRRSSERWIQPPNREKVAARIHGGGEEHSSNPASPTTPSLDPGFQALLEPYPEG